MGEDNKYDCWGLSLSLKPPLTYSHPITLCKTEPLFSTDVGTTRMDGTKGTTLMGVEVKAGTWPLVIDLEEVDTAKVSSSNSTLSSTLGGFGGDHRDTTSDEENGGSRGNGEREERKKLRLSKEQIMVLEQAFKQHTTLNTKQKVVLARQVNLRPRQVEVWFQNRRARTKLKQTEVDREYLKRFCATLTEENRKLQKELQQLRAFKASSPGHHQSLMHVDLAPTTLTMCPSCKSVSLPSSSSPSTTSPRASRSEVSRYQLGVLHQQVPLSLKKLSLTTTGSNRVFESQLPTAKCELL